MDPNLTTAIVSPCAAAIVAIVAIVNNNKRFDHTNSRLARVESKLDTMLQMLAAKCSNS